MGDSDRNVLASSLNDRTLHICEDGKIPKLVGSGSVDEGAVMGTSRAAVRFQKLRYGQVGPEPAGNAVLETADSFGEFDHFPIGENQPKAVGDGREIGKADGAGLEVAENGRRIEAVPEAEVLDDHVGPAIAGVQIKLAHVAEENGIPAPVGAKHLCKRRVRMGAQQRAHKRGGQGVPAQSQILCKLPTRREQIRIQCVRQRIYPTAALCAV